MTDQVPPPPAGEPGSGAAPPPSPPPPPAYGAPTYGAPTYGAPAYGAPTPTTPSYGSPGYPGFAVPGGDPWQQPPRSQQPLAIVALVLSLLSCGLISFVMALVAFVKADKAPGTGRRIAAIAMVTSLLVPTLLVGGVYAFGDRFADLREPTRDAGGQVTDSGRVDKNDLRVGDCVDDPQLAALDEGESTDRASATVKVLPCDEPHDMEVLATYPQRSDDSPTAKKTENTCLRKVAKEFRDDLGVLDPLSLSLYTNPTGTDGNVICLGARRDGEKLTAPVR